MCRDIGRLFTAVSTADCRLVPFGEYDYMTGASLDLDVCN